MERGYGKFMLLWMGTFLSAIGSGLSSFGLGIYVFHKTGLASATAMVILAGFLPGLLLSPLAGVLADRFDRRMLMITGDGLSGLGILLIIAAISFDVSGIAVLLFGIAISSVFSALVEPAYKATVSDLLDRKDFSKASGMMQITNSAKYLISPLLAGVLLSFSEIRLLLYLDLFTLVPMILLTNRVRKEIPFKSNQKEKPALFQELKMGYGLLRRNKGVWKLLEYSCLLSVFLGILQTLMTPFILSFFNEQFLGFATSFSSLGILVSSGLLGVLGLKGHYHKTLSFSMLLAGVFMASFGISGSKGLICFFGFLFFSTLPYANASMDYLVRTNLDAEVQGKAWGFIGLISQLGYAVSYIFSGLIADYVVSPLMKSNLLMERLVHAIFGGGEGNSFALVILFSGVGLSLSGILLSRSKAVIQLEDVSS